VLKTTKVCHHILQTKLHYKYQLFMALRWLRHCFRLMNPTQRYYCFVFLSSPGMHLGSEGNVAEIPKMTKFLGEGEVMLDCWCNWPSQTGRNFDEGWVCPVVRREMCVSQPFYYFWDQHFPPRPVGLKICWDRPLSFGVRFWCPDISASYNALNDPDLCL